MGYKKTHTRQMVKLSFALLVCSKIFQPLLNLLISIVAKEYNVFVFIQPATKYSPIKQSDLTIESSNKTWRLKI